jgi:hypothetical protein
MLREAWSKAGRRYPSQEEIISGAFCSGLATRRPFGQAVWPQASWL